ncbi:MAG: hypothetical protein H0X29_00550 [Parachlamydiaceae bacterium]|nr:hypothetical protein [Parachlamydiaceae bacterium]
MFKANDQSSLHYSNTTNEVCNPNDAPKTAEIFDNPSEVNSGLNEVIQSNIGFSKANDFSNKRVMIVKQWINPKAPNTQLPNKSFPRSESNKFSLLQESFVKDPRNMQRTIGNEVTLNKPLSNKGFTGFTPAGLALYTSDAEDDTLVTKDKDATILNALTSEACLKAHSPYLAGNPIPELIHPENVRKNWDIKTLKHQPEKCKLSKFENTLAHVETVFKKHLENQMAFRSFGMNFTSMQNEFKIPHGSLSVHEAREVYTLVAGLLKEAQEFAFRPPNDIKDQVIGQGASETRHPLRELVRLIGPLWAQKIAEYIDMKRFGNKMGLTPQEFATKYNFDWKLLAEKACGPNTDVNLFAKFAEYLSFEDSIFLVDAWLDGLVPTLENTWSKQKLNEETVAMVNNVAHIADGISKGTIIWRDKALSAASVAKDTSFHIADGIGKGAAIWGDKVLSAASVAENTFSRIGNWVGSFMAPKFANEKMLTKEEKEAERKLISNLLINLDTTKPPKASYSKTAQFSQGENLGTNAKKISVKAVEKEEAERKLISNLLLLRNTKL